MTTNPTPHTDEITRSERCTAPTLWAAEHNNCNDIAATVDRLLAEETQHLAECLAAAERAEQRLIEHIANHFDEEAEQLARLVDSMDEEAELLARIANEHD